MTLSQIARRDLGKKEKPNNGGFYDNVLEKEMIKDGWSKGMSWCSIICEKWAEEAFPDKEGILDGLFDASAVQTFSNFKKAGFKISSKPVKDAIVIWQRYNNGVKSWMGHAGVVSEVISDKEFKSIEGNTNSSGSREGDVVAEKTRKIIKLETGLNVLGFIIIN